jgi:hypothetical protein
VLGGRLGLAGPEDQVDVDRLCVALATVTVDRDGGSDTVVEAADAPVGSPPERP